MLEFAAHRDHKRMHSCVVVVLTHGEYDFITGVDGKKINLHDFLACLNAKNSPDLAGKPKIFFLQACRGGFILNLFYYDCVVLNVFSQS